MQETATCVSVYEFFFVFRILFFCIYFDGITKSFVNNIIYQMILLHMLHKFDNSIYGIVCSRFVVVVVAVVGAACTIRQQNTEGSYFFFYS